MLKTQICVTRPKCVKLMLRNKVLLSIGITWKVILGGVEGGGQNCPWLFGTLIYEGVKLKKSGRICVEKKNQLDATEWFIGLIICSTCFGHFYAHHQELETICVLLPPMVCDALIAGCWRSGAGQQAMRSGCCTTSRATSLIPDA